MPDPRLKDAMRKIQKILRQFDVAGSIMLISKSHSEFLYHFPTWSAVQPERSPDGAPGLRIRSYEAYYGDKEKQRLAMEESLHCLYSMRALAGQTFLMFESLCEQVEKVSGFEIEHQPFSGFEPHASNELDEEDG